MINWKQEKKDLINLGWTALFVLVLVGLVWAYIQAGPF